MGSKIQEDLGAVSFPLNCQTNHSPDCARCFLRTGLNALMALSISMVLVPYSVGFFVPSIFEAFSCKFSKHFKLQQIDFNVSSEWTVPPGKYCLFAFVFSSNINQGLGLSICLR